MRRTKATGRLLVFSLMMALAATIWAALPVTGAKSDAAPAKAPAVPEQLTREEIRDLLSTLSDDEVRALLIRELDKHAVARTGDSSDEDMDAVEAFHQRVEIARLRLLAIFGAWPMLSKLPADIWSLVTQAGTVPPWRIIVGLVLMFVLAWAAETWLRRSTGIGVTSPVASPPEGFVARLGASVGRALTQLLALLVYAVVAFTVLFVAVWNNDGGEPLFMMILSTVLVMRMFAILMDVVLSPRDAGLRLVALSDDAARKLRSRLLMLVALPVVNAVITDSLDVFGVDPKVQALLGLVVATVFVVALIVVFWEGRDAYAAIIRGDTSDQAPGERGFVNTVAAYWHLIATGAVLMLFALAVGRFGVQGTDVRDYAGIKSLILLLALPLVDVGLRRFVARIFRGAEESEGEEESSLLTLAPAGDREASKAASREIRAVVLKNFRIVMGLIAILLILAFWGVEPGVMATNVAGERVGSAFFDIVITTLLAYAIWSLVKAAVSYHVESDASAEANGGGGRTENIGGAGQTRLQTLLPLFRKIILITLVIMGVLIVLSSLGVNIGPLIAGAGVVGLAIGFGAQALVRDIVSGIFFLLDDAFRMGEYVEIGDVRGVVEAISVRSLRLRHHNGPLHTIPFGEIKHLTNYSRDWAIMKFELRLPFEADIDKVRKIIKTVGQEMEQDEELAPLMLTPLKSQGVNRMEDSALIVRCKFTAVPGQQFYVRREAFTRIQKAFEEHGIRFAPKRVIVEAASPQLAIAGAAALESEEPQTDADKKPDDRG